jgi:hypothetical protein
LATRRKKQIRRKPTTAIRIFDIVAVGGLAASMLNGAGGNVIHNAKTGNFAGAIEAIPKNLQGNLNAVGTALAFGIAGKMLRRSRLAPTVGVPKVVNIGV